MPDLKIKTASAYWKKVQSYEYDRIETIAATIPLNLNRAGTHYRKLLKKLIHEQPHQTK